MKHRPPIIVVTGGARSGKSRFALTRAAKFRPPHILLATAEAGDDEMAARIARHRAERDRRWRTVEEPTEIAAVLRRRRAGVVVIDCLTLWLANIMDGDPRANVDRAFDELVAALGERRFAVVAVTNEVGLGIVPANRLARAYRDAAGTMNQRVAEAADEVHLLVAGQAMRIK
jgi:adenosyl cobinamide kinase/adenosyl cobinamide phosphate guanylyltransferase